MYCWGCVVGERKLEWGLHKMTKLGENMELLTSKSL